MRMKKRWNSSGLRSHNLTIYSIIGDVNKGINNGKKIAFIDLKLRGGGI